MGYLFFIGVSECYLENKLICNSPFPSERSSTASSNNSSITASSTPNASSNLARSRRSTFGTPGGAAVDGNGSDAAPAAKIRILYEYERLVQYSKSPHAWALPADWTKICLKAPNIVRNKVNTDGAKILEMAYSWLKAAEGDENNTATTTNNNPSVKFQRNLSFDDSNKSRTENPNWLRKSFDAKRSPLVHSKSTIN